MDVTPLVKVGKQIIQNYKGGRFKVNGEVFEHPVLVFVDETIKWDIAEQAEDLSIKSFQQLLEQTSDIDVVLLGTGDSMEFISPKLRQELKDKGLSVEPMDTGAACRTYNVLMAEERRVVAALLPTSR